MCESLRNEKQIRICALYGRDKYNPKYRGPANKNFVQTLALGGEISNTLTSVQKDNYVFMKENENLIPKNAIKKECTEHVGTSWYVEHLEARELKSITPCEICGSTSNVDIHHVDGDWHNNSIDNLKCLCRSCHMKMHREKKTCIICGKPMKGHGYCNKHYIRYKKYGDPLYTKYGEEVININNEEQRIRIRKLTPLE